jgi:hypothetical protein
MLFESPEGTQSQYEMLTKEIFGSLQPSEPPEGLILHAAGPMPDGGWRVIDVWESEEAFWRFFDKRVLPAAGELAEEPPDARPEFFAIHNLIAGPR